MTERVDPPQGSSTLPPVMCSGVLRLRDPPVYNGTEDQDVEDWLAEYEHASAINKWDDPAKLIHVIFYLTDLANLWFTNHQADIPTWSVFKEAVTSFFGRPAMRKLRAELGLRGRFQRNGESFTSYIEDVISLCRRVDARMTEADRIKNIMKGIDDDAFHMLVAKDPQTVTAVIQLCQSFDELRKQRVSTRRANTQTADISALECKSSGPDYSVLMPQIQQYIREEVARQLSLVATINETPTTLDHSLRRAIQTQVAEALPSPTSPISVAAPLTYAEAVRRPPAQPPLPSYSPATNYYRSPVSVYPVNRPFPPPRAPVNSWRTPDNRPVCYNCGIPGHVARYCRRRGFYFNDVQHSGNIPRPSESHVTPDSHDPRSRRPDFSRRRSPSPRLRSPSPMLRRSNHAQEEN